MMSCKRTYCIIRCKHQQQNTQTPKQYWLSLSGKSTERESQVIFQSSHVLLYTSTSNKFLNFQDFYLTKYKTA